MNGLTWTSSLPPPALPGSGSDGRRISVRPLSPAPGLPLTSMLARHSCQTWSVPDRRQRLQDARLYLGCDDRPFVFPPPGLRGGVNIGQLPMKEAEEGAIVSGGRLFARLC